MRYALTLAVLLGAAPLFGAENQFSIFGTNLGYVESATMGSRWSGGVGVAFSRSWNERWSTELAVSDERHSIRVFPVDALAQYRLANSSRWTPYVSMGMRTVNDVHRRTTGEVGLGTTFRLTDRAGFRLDVMRLLRSDDVSYDPLIRPSFGFTFKF